MVFNSTLKRKGQSSVEFAILISFTLLVASVLFAVMQGNILDAQKTRDEVRVQQVMRIIENEIVLARASSIGSEGNYSRDFFLPMQLYGHNYEIEGDSSGPGGFMDVVIRFKGEEYVYLMPETDDVLAPENLGRGVNTIRKSCTGGTCTMEFVGPVDPEDIIPPDPDPEIPFIAFVEPTPDNDTTIVADNAVINVSIDVPEGLEEFRFDWNGADHTLYDDSLVLMMNFDNVASIGDTSTIATDVSLYENHGTISGATWTVQGKHNGGIMFDGTDYIDIGTDGFPSIGSSITMAAWAKYGSEEPEGYQNIIAISSGESNQSVQLGFRDEKIVAWKYGGEHLVNHSELPTPGTWNHYTYTYNGGEHRLYLNGELVNTNNEAPDTGPAAEARIGSWLNPDSLEGFNGTIDEVRIWNRALSEEEIRQLYQSNLYKYDSGSWAYTANQASLSSGSYEYQAFATNQESESSQTERRILHVQEDFPFYAFSITTDSSLVEHPNTNLYYDLSLAPDEFWDHVRRDGGDIRVYREDTMEQVAREVVMPETSRLQYAWGEGSIAEAEFDRQPQEGNLLVAVSFHRYSSETPEMISNGWEKVTSIVSELGNSSYRKGMAIWYKEAGENEPTQVSTTWDDPSLVDEDRENVLVIQEFSGSYELDVYSTGDSEDTEVSSLSTGETDPSSQARSLVLGVKGIREEVGSATWTNGLNNNIRVFTEELYDKTVQSAYRTTNTVQGWETTPEWDEEGPALSAIIVFSEQESSRKGSLFFDSTGLSTEEDTTWIVTFGNETLEEPEPDSAFGKHNVWDSDYAGVWHLDDTDSTIRDSTSNENHGSAFDDVLLGVNGKTGRGAQFDGDGIYASHIEVPHSGSLAMSDEVSVQAWVRPNAPGQASASGIVGKARSNCCWYEYGMRLNPSNTIRFDAPGVTGTPESSDGQITTNGWTQVTLTFDGEQKKFFFDGEEDRSISITGSFQDSNQPLRFGRIYERGSDWDDTRRYEGVLDEVRISRIARPADWVRTEYNNQNNPGAFWTTGEVTGDPGVPEPGIAITREQYLEGSVPMDGGVVSFNEPVGEGNLLVVVSGHRLSEDDPDIGGDGWERHFSEITLSGENQFRRGLAVWSKVAGSSEPGIIEIDWGGESGRDAWVVLMEFSGADDYDFFDFVTSDSGEDSVNELFIGTVGSPGSQDVLVIGATAHRDAISGPVSYSGLGDEEHYEYVEPTGGYTAHASTAFTYSNSGDHDWYTTASWDDFELATGALLVFELS